MPSQVVLKLYVSSGYSISGSCEGVAKQLFCCLEWPADYGGCYAIALVFQVVAKVLLGSVLCFTR